MQTAGNLAKARKRFVYLVPKKVVPGLIKIASYVPAFLRIRRVSPREEGFKEFGRENGLNNAHI